MRPTARLALLTGAASLLFLAACRSVGPDYVGVRTRVPDTWTRNVLRDLGPGSELTGWWRGFNDPALNELIERTRVSNPGLRGALARITEARAQRGIAVSQGLPQANAQATYSRNRSSESLGAPVGDNPRDFYSTGFDAGWEIDLFGGIRRSVQAADANLEAREEDYRDALVTLFAEVALAYVDYRTLEERIAVAQRNISAQRESVELTQGRLDAGLVPRIDVTQATTNLALSEATVPQLRSQLAAAKNRLASLSGGYPSSVESLLARSRGIPVPKAGFSSGLPADLLRARPDIRSAERDLAAQTARIGIAEAELYPRLTLVGDFQLQSLSSGDLFDSASRAYSFGPSFRWQIFSAGRIRNSIAAEESRAMQALAAYETTVLGAVEEVETSMAAIVNERDRLGDLGRAVASSRETVKLVKDNYEGGLVNFQSVLDSERTRLEAEDQEAFSRGQLAQNYIRLYKALGGGTECEAIPVPAKPVRVRKGKPGGGQELPLEAVPQAAARAAE